MDRRILPLPPPSSVSKPRNESMNSNMPGYRNRPNGSSNPVSQFANAKSLFESFNTPAIRNGMSQLAKNPLAQRAAVALAKNDTIRTAAVNTACKQATGNEPDPFVSQMAHGSIKNMVSQFESKPIMGMGSTTATSPPGDRTSQFSMNSMAPANTFNYDSKPEPSSYKNLTAIDPFEYPPQLPSSYSTQDSYANRSKSTDPYRHGIQQDDYQGYEQSRKLAPSRPPPPKAVSNSWSNHSLSSPETLTNKAHAIAKYPYKGAHVDELSFEPKDTLLLQHEVDDQWVSAMNTRTGLSGIVPISFLDIRIPLAPSSALSSALPPRQQNIPLPALPTMQSQSTILSYNKQVMKALYDYHSDVEGDLSFNAGDLIVVYETVENDWLNGELKGKFGIFPASYVQSTDGSTPQTPTIPIKTVTALYDYASGVAEDLQFRANDTIDIVEEVSPDWIKGRLPTGAIGLVPLTYVKRN